MCWYNEVVADFTWYIANLRSRGRVHFSLREATHVLGKPVKAIEAAANQPTTQNNFVRLVRGFYLILSAQNGLACTPDPLRWIDALMSFLGVRYRVSLHQTARAPDSIPSSLRTYYVVVPKRLAAISVEGYRIQFLSLAPELFEKTNRLAWLEKVSTGPDFVTAAGTELALLDAALFFHQEVALECAPSILACLGDKGSPDKLAEIASVCSPDVVRRLGCLLRHFGHEQQAQAVLHVACPNTIQDDAPTYEQHLPGVESLLCSEVVRLSAEMKTLQTKSAEETDFLRAELSRLHHLVTARLTKEIEYLHKQAYDLKRIVYHSDQMVSPAAFNGQFSKHRIFSALCSRFPFDAFVETGTYLGGTTEFLATHGKPVYSVECNPEFHEKAQLLFRHLPLVHLTLADSLEFLRSLLGTDLPPEAMSFFYLDAHWNHRLPLADEIRIIAHQHPHAVVMVDDIKVEDDDSYGYDAYDLGQQITLGFLQGALRESNWQVFFPSLPAALDHNANDILPPRGTAVLACEQEAIDTLKEVKELRHWPF